MSLEKLAVMQYRLTTEKNRLIEERSVEISKCSIAWVRVSRDPFIDNPVFQTQTVDKKEREEALDVMSDFTDLKPDEMENCYAVIMRELKSGDIDYYDYINFDEALYTYGCSHCQKARTLKREIGRIGRKIGQIRGQITRYGKRFSEQDK